MIDLGLNDRSMEALQAGDLDAALLPPEKAFLAQAQGLCIIADCHDLDCQWVPLATTRDYLSANRDLVGNVAAVYRESIRFFKSERPATLEVLAGQLPGLKKHPQVLEKCYEVFAELFEPTLTLSLSALGAVLDEVALQDSRARNIDPAALVQRVF